MQTMTGNRRVLKVEICYDVIVKLYLVIHTLIQNAKALVKVLLTPQPDELVDNFKVVC